MKRIIIIIGIIAAALSLKAGNENYTNAMKQQLILIDSAKTEVDYQNVISVLERIATAETTKWHPSYYIAYSYLNIAFRQPDMPGRDAKLDLAQTWIDKAASIAPNNAEIMTLQGYILMMKVSVDPATRGQQLVGKTMQSFGQALAIESQNPRAMYLMGQMSFGTAQFFNSDTSEACGMVNQAVSFFESPSTNTDPLAPRWGKKSALAMQKQCNTK